MIRVISPGLQTTVQDLGRHGLGPLGVSPSGAADPVSLRIGNRLAGNPPNAAALEMTLMGGAYLFEEECAAALAGSDFVATLDGEPVAVWTSFEIRPGQTLKLAHTKTGARCYLCVYGGVAVPPFLGSASTHLLSGLGGVEGRALIKGDALDIGSSSGGHRARRVDPKALESLAPRRALSQGNSEVTLRVTPGPQSGRFQRQVLDLFHGSTYHVTEDANRTGIRLEGPPIEDSGSGDMITEGVTLGAVQVPSSGRPIILGVEQQTAGGYPKIANVASVDLAMIGQLRPRDQVRFIPASYEEVVEALRIRERLLESDDWIQE